jgi:hypothetical protein
MTAPLGSPAAEAIADILARELGRMADQIRAYQDEEAIWVLDGTIRNSAGTLAAHGAGNILHFVGAVLGGTEYERNREAEFSGEWIPRTELIRHLDEASHVVHAVLPGMTEDELEAPFPELPDRYAGASTYWFLTHLTSHLSWHLGQMDYHRRILAERGTPEV